MKTPMLYLRLPYGLSLRRSIDVMTIDAWFIFASFWVLFVTTPRPNAVNCVSVAMVYRFRTSLICVLGFLTQATLFLVLSAFGIIALISASSSTFELFKWNGAAFLIYLGVRGWITPTRPISQDVPISSEVYVKSFLLATINPKSIAGYLAAFSQFVVPSIRISAPMCIRIPTTLCLTTLSYASLGALYTGLGYTGLSTILNVWFKRVLAICFIIYRFLLGLSPFPRGM